MRQLPFYVESTTLTLRCGLTLYWESLRSSLADVTLAWSLLSGSSLLARTPQPSTSQ